MQVKTITHFLESLAPLSYQEDYDNSGLIVGDPEMNITGALISLDCTEEIIDEAISKGCNLVISHHPIVFKGLKKFSNKTYVERALIKAIKNEIALYAIHTNFDNILEGVNAKICEVINLKNCSILAPKPNLLKKIVTYVPIAQAEQVRAALFDAGAGNIGNYSECSFSMNGQGTFKAGENSNAFVGEKGFRHQENETRIEVIYPFNRERQILVALHLTHPYEEVAYDLHSISNNFHEVGSGMIGSLDEEIDAIDFLNYVKEKLKIKVIRHTALISKKIKRVAVCGGAGSFLLPNAIMAGADVFITSDFKYHEFFDADQKIIVADVGHYESEQFTQELLFKLITKKFPSFVLLLTEQNTNPINYLI